MTCRASGWAYGQTGVSPHSRLLLLVLGENADDCGSGVFLREYLLRLTSLTEDELDTSLSELAGAALLFIREPLGALRAGTRFAEDDPTFVLALEGSEALTAHSAWLSGMRAHYCTPEFLDRLSTSKPALKRRAIQAFACSCVYCERQGTPDLDPDGWTWELDRIHPGASGGAYVADNVALACRACNRDKRARLDWDTDTVSLAVLEAQR